MGHGIFSAFSREVLVLFCFLKGPVPLAEQACFAFGTGLVGLLPWAGVLSCASGRCAELCLGSAWFAEARAGAVLRRGRQETGGG